MPIRKTSKGWYWGSKGPFDTKEKAEEVMRAAFASGYKSNESISFEDMLESMKAACVLCPIIESEDKGSETYGKLIDDWIHSIMLSRGSNKLYRKQLLQIAADRFGELTPEMEAEILQQAEADGIVFSDENVQVKPQVQDVFQPIGDDEFAQRKQDTEEAFDANSGRYYAEWEAEFRSFLHSGSSQFENTLEDLKSMAFASLEEIDVEPTPERVKGFVEHYVERNPISPEETKKIKSFLEGYYE